jgi:hypothetical protein
MTFGTKKVAELCTSELPSMPPILTENWQLRNVVGF